jgi:hypothetical protein
VVGKMALGQVFTGYFGFPCQFSFHRLQRTHHLSSGAGTIGRSVADVPSGLSLALPQEAKKNLFNPNLRHIACNLVVLINIHYNALNYNERLQSGLGRCERYMKVYCSFKNSP